MTEKTSEELQPETITFAPREVRDKATGRRYVQLTSGEAHCYPLYYFIPTATEDGRIIVFYRWAGESNQMYALDVASGQARRLTNATSPNASWRPWAQLPSSGVSDQLSAFNTVTKEVIYFDGNTLHGVHIDSLEDRVIHVIAPDRKPCALTGVSPDGKLFAFAHLNRDYFENVPAKGPNKWEARGCVIELVELEACRSRRFMSLNTWITHLHFQDNNRLLFCHPPTENGIMVADVSGNWYTHIRTQDGPNLVGPVPIEQTSHYQASSQGIVYEMRTKLGLCDPYTFECQEYLVENYPVTHVGRDPEARLWFFDTKQPHPETGAHTGPRCICYMPELKFNQPNRAQVLLSEAITWGEGQHSHLHPVLMPDRKNILFITGDARTRTNHMALLDVSDLADTRREQANRP